MNKEFFRGMKEQIEPDEEQVEELKNKLNNTAVVSRKPMWIGLFRSIDNSTYLQLSCIFHAITNLVIFSIHLSMKLINPSKLHSSPFV